MNRLRSMKALKPDLPLTLILVLSAFLNVYGIWSEKYANSYYTAAVASMLKSFHAFFYGSFDPVGFVTVDKPPVVFWIQTAFAALFGVHGWSVILPQALAGMGSVLLLYSLVKPSFGIGAARLSALAMAVTPIAVAVSRTNNIDSMLVFTLLLGTWLLFRSVRGGSIWLTLGAFAVIGLAFNMKMLQAYMVLPAFYLFYWVASKLNWKKRIGALAAATAALLVVSLSWPVIVDSVPADQRPYIGSSQTNSVLELAFGYNGISRLTGDRGQGGGGRGQGGAGMFNGGEAGTMNGPGAADSQNNAQNGAQDGGRGSDGQLQPDGQAPRDNGSGFTPAEQDGRSRPDGSGEGAAFDGGQGRFARDGGGMMQGGPGGGSGGMFGTGAKGALRLFQSALSGQASWLIPFAFFGAFGILASLRRRSFTPRHKEALFWLAWLLPAMVFFSVAGFFHQYYLIMLAPPVAALAGSGWSELWRRFREGVNWTSWLFPVAVAATAAFEWYIVHPYDKKIGSGWSMAILLAGGAITLLLAVQRLRRRAVPLLAAGLAFMVLLIGPMYWAVTPITYGQNSQLPEAGPGTSSGFGGGGPGGGGFGQMQMPGGRANTADGGNRGGPEGGEAIDEGLYSYLKEHNTGEKFLFATTRYNTAVPYIIEKGEAVMAMGGFSGSDPILTVDSLKALVEKGDVKYFLLGGGGMGGGPGGGSSEVTQWIIKNGKEIPASDYSSGGSGSGFGGGTLYEVTGGNT